MNIVIAIDDSSIKEDIIRMVNCEVDKFIKSTLKSTDISSIIETRVQYHVDKSAQLSERTLRNYVQQKIARQLATTLFKES